MKGIVRLNRTIQVYRPFQVVPLDFRLSGDAAECFGVQAIVVGRTPMDSPVIPVFGEYSLEFEGKKIHPVNFTVPLVSQEHFTDQTHHRPELLPLSIQPLQNRMVTGFYRDLGMQEFDPETAEFIPYKVRFTFHCYKS
jgi:hypothetical protein